MKISKHFWDSLHKLVALIGEDNIQEIEIERRFLGGKIRIVRTGPAPQAVPSGQPPMVPAVAPVPGDFPAGSSESESMPHAVEEGLHAINSPMVGMFYRSPNPDAPSYAEEGDVVSPGQTLCIIEAMKIMNEIESDFKGRVVRVLVENGKPVEYNTPLFLLEPM